MISQDILTEYLVVSLYVCYRRFVVEIYSRGSLSMEISQEESPMA